VFFISESSFIRYVFCILSISLYWTLNNNVRKKKPGIVLRNAQPTNLLDVCNIAITIAHKDICNIFCRNLFFISRLFDKYITILFMIIPKIIPNVPKIIHLHP
jgi:hypothetical protein